jgi:nucleoid-associated protein YgaU
MQVALSRSGMLTISAGALAAVSAASIGYRVWRDFSAGAPGAATPRSTPPLGSERKPLPSRPSLASHAPAAAPLPAFDVVRVEPSGDAVVAGRAAPHSTVTLLDNGKPLDHATADDAGQFAMVPPALSKGNHELSLDMTVASGAAHSVETVTVVIPSQKSGRLVVALAAPGQPTRVLNDSAAAPLSGKPAAPVPGASRRVFIQTVDVGQDGGFLASGSAPPGAALRLYLNDSPVAAVTADAGGRWSLKVEKGLQPGSYTVRADQLSRTDGKVLSRAETRFDFAGFAVAAGAVASETGQPGAAGANAVLADVPTVQVAHGDNLWRISRRIFGHGIRYTLIYEANATQIRDRNLIYPGQIFVVPKT